MKLMKKITFLFAAGILLPCALFAGSRKDVDSFLKTYEAFVVEYEKAAESNDMTAMMNAAVKANELAEKQKTLESSQHWTQKDAQKILALTARLSAAMQKLNASAGAASSPPF